MGSCAAKPVKRTTASLKLTVPLLTNPSNYTIKLIQPSLFYNLVTRDFNRESAGQPKNESEYIDFRDQASFRESHLKTAINIDSNVLVNEGREEIYRSLKVILDFKKLVIIGEELVLNGNEISEDLAEFIMHLEAAKISITMIYILDTSISKFLKRFPFLSHERDSHFDGKYFPLLLYTQNDKVPIIKSQLSLPKQADMKYKVPETELPTQLLMETTVYIQEYTRFRQSFDEKVYIDVLGIRNILIMTNNDAANQSGSPEEKKFETFHIVKDKRPVVYNGNLNNRRAVYQILAKLVKQPVPFIIIHGKKDAETTVNSFVEFLELNQRVKGSSVRFYIEERIPKLKLSQSIPPSDVQIDQKKMSRVLDNQTDEKAIKSRLEEIDDCMLALKKACKGNMEEVNAVYNLLSRIIDNIMKSPEEEKYRALNQNNAKLKETIFKYEASKRLVELIGFYKKEDGGSSQYYNPLDVKTMKHIKVDVDIGYKNIQTTEVI